MRRLLFVLGVSACVLGCNTTSTTPQVQVPGVTVAGSPTDGPNSDGANPNGPWIGAAPASDAFVAGAQETFVAVWIDVPNASATARAPAAVSLVIDTSGSMAGDKIKNAREAAQKLVDSLRDGDMVSIHTFSDSVTERVHLTKLDARSRAQIASSIAEVRADGSTNLFEGVRVAGMSVMEAPATHAVRRVVLISDGNATVGNTSTDMIGMLGEKAGDHSVQVTAIGVGLDYNERALNQLATKSSGRLYHLTESKNLPEIVQSEMALLKSSRAANAKVAVVPAPGVELLGVDGVRGSFMNGTLEVPLGALSGGQHKEFIVRARITAPQSGTHPLASVRLAFDDPTEGNLSRVQETVARYEVVGDATAASSRKNVKAQGVFAMIDASATTEAAALALNDDHFDDADKKLAATEQNLRAAAQKASSKADKERFTQSANRVSATRAGAGAAAAAPAPKKAEARRKAALEANDAALDFSGN